jgi:hypoxanthine-DNA glycosylase
MRMTHKQGLPPLLSSDIRILILGSLPSDYSIEKQEYYAKPSNDFWKLLGTALKCDLYAMTYEKRLECLENFKIGLWDVLKEARREGSDDSKIKEEVVNDFEEVFENCKELRLICCNGKKASSYASLVEDLAKRAKREIEVRALPSSSGLNRRNMEKREREWVSVIGGWV